MATTSEPILYESHMHTPLCRHAVGEPEEYAAVAAERGLKGIIVTCHNPLPDGLAQGSRMYPQQFEEYVALVDRARRACADQIDVRLGLEADYLPGLEPFLQQQLAQSEFHHVLGSVHPQLSEYQARYFNGDRMQFQRTYFEHIADAAETGLFDTLAHPDLVKNIAPKEWHLERIMPAIEAALDRIAAAGTAMELNTSGLLKAIPEMNPNATMLRAMRQRNIPVVIGADAHTPRRVAAHYETALDLLEQAGYTEISFFLERQRQTVTIDVARSSLRQPSP
ncbi:MAG: histidinol-phosphatase [Armatimonadota bacterium]|nr:histidinol-phosphatase [Armatimonadota bacterium]